MEYGSQGDIFMFDSFQGESRPDGKQIIWKVGHPFTFRNRMSYLQVRVCCSPSDWRQISVPQISVECCLLSCMSVSVLWSGLGTDGVERTDLIVYIAYVYSSHDYYNEMVWFVGKVGFLIQNLT